MTTADARSTNQMGEHHRRALGTHYKLGSGLVDQSQKMTVAARAMADKKAVGHLS